MLPRRNARLMLPVDHPDFMNEFVAEMQETRADRHNLAPRHLKGPEMMDRLLTGNHPCCLKEEPCPAPTCRTQIDVQQRPSTLLRNFKRNLLRQGVTDEKNEDRALQLEFSKAFSESHADLGNVECIATTSTILLYGFVRSYHDLQKAIQIARSIVKDRLITLDVEVIPRVAEASLPRETVRSKRKEDSPD